MLPLLGLRRQPQGCRTGGNDGRMRPVVMPGLQREEKTAWLRADLFSEAQLQLPMEAK